MHGFARVCKGLLGFRVCEGLGFVRVCGVSGHIELQGQTLYSSLGRIASMYGDITYDITTEKGFALELSKLFKNVAQTLGIHLQVRPKP